MTIVLPTGDVIDTTGRWLQFDSGTVTIKLDGTTVYTPATPAEWYELQRLIVKKFVEEVAVLNLAPAVLPRLDAANPDAVVHDAGATITITGDNFQPGATWSITYPGLAGGWVKADIVSFSPTQVVLAMPILPAAGSQPVVSVVNPDGSSASYQMLATT